jgi:hypothetical protein
MLVEIIKRCWNLFHWPEASDKYPAHITYGDTEFLYNVLNRVFDSKNIGIYN